MSDWNASLRSATRSKDLGLIYRARNLERTKRYFREPPGQPRIHIHVRETGSFAEQFPLLFRDFLRVHREAAAGYEEVKRHLPRATQSGLLHISV